MLVLLFIISKGSSPVRLQLPVWIVEYS